MSDFDKEQFLEEIHSFGSWVKSGDDLMKYCRHIKYRMLQSQAVDKWYQDNIKLTEEQHGQISKIVCDYNHAYENHNSKFQPFNEAFTK